MPTARQSRHRHIDRCLEITIDNLNRLSLQESPLVDSEEVLSIVFLCDLIDKRFGTSKDAYRASGSLRLGIPRPLQTRMLRDGWCKNDVYRLSHQLDLSSLYLANNLDRPSHRFVTKIAPLDCVLNLRSMKRNILLITIQRAVMENVCMWECRRTS
jgi:hypothetical protein